MILPIVTTPNPILHKRSAEIQSEELSDPNMQVFFDNMIETMHTEDGIGLAAVQVGKLIRAVVVTRNGLPEIFINPVITKRSLRKVHVEESCLSVPGMTGDVQRARSITIKAQNRHGQNVEIVTNEFDAIIFQHEIDHMDGILFTERAKRIRGKDSL